MTTNMFERRVKRNWLSRNWLSGEVLVMTAGFLAGELAKLILVATTSGLPFGASAGWSSTLLSLLVPVALFHVGALFGQGSGRRVHWLANLATGGFCSVLYLLILVLFTLPATLSAASGGGIARSFQLTPLLCFPLGWLAARWRSREVGARPASSSLSSL